MRRRVLLSRLILWPLVAASFFVGSQWNDHVIVEGLLFCAACMLVAVATGGRLWCALYIGGYKTRQLVTSGPYSMCRHPLYLFSLIGLLGVGCSTRTVTIPAVLTLMYALSYRVVIRSEDRFLENLHGEAYRSYASGVPRFWPRLAGLREPAEYQVVPAKFRQAMGDALGFMGLIGIIGLAEALRDAGIIPTVIKLY